MKKAYIKAFLMSLVLSVLLGACSNTWDEHYSTSGEAQASETVLDLLKADASLSTFVSMCHVAGVDSLLASSQTFTIFAPDNSALSGIDLGDEALVRRVVLNHIARFNNSTATEGSVKMYNGKRFSFSEGTFAGTQIDKADMVARNGIVHTLRGQIPYNYNLREYIDTHESTSRLSAFLSRFDTKVMDLENSQPIGVDENGATVYDSVLISYNPIFNLNPGGLGDIANEDSIFTMIIPDNLAWDKAYERIRPYFNVYDKDQAVADSIADVQTSLAIVNDLIFRSVVNDPFSSGTLMTTSGSKITDVASHFMGTEKLQGSNGLIYLTSDLNYDNTLTWDKPLEVEAELQEGRTTGMGTTIYTRNVDPSNPLSSEISELRYIDVTPNTASRQPSVTFTIPDVLSGEYDIYVSFVPAVIADASNTEERTKVQFTLTYVDTNGRNKSETFKSDDYVTDPLEMTMMKVAEGYKFPVSNYYDRLWLGDDSHSEYDRVNTTKLYVITNVSNSEFNSNKYVRQFRVDRIVLVPVKK